MNDRAKKILLVSAFIISVIGIATALYFAFFRATPPAPTVAPQPEQIPAGTLPTGAVGGARQAPTARDVCEADIRSSGPFVGRWT